MFFVDSLCSDFRYFAFNLFTLVANPMYYLCFRWTITIFNLTIIQLINLYEIQHQGLLHFLINPDLGFLDLFFII